MSHIKLYPRQHPSRDIELSSPRIIDHYWEVLGRIQTAKGAGVAKCSLDSDDIASNISEQSLDIKGSFNCSFHFHQLGRLFLILVVVRDLFTDRLKTFLLRSV